MTASDDAKVLHIETGQHLYGGALQVLYLLGGLQGAGWRNVLACTKGSDVAREARDVVERVCELPMGGDLDATLVARLVAIIKEERPALVHLHSRRGADLWGGIAARLSRVPVILTRRVDNPEPGWWVALKYRLFHRVVTISNGIRDVMISEGLPADKLTCIHSAVDTERYRPGGDLNWFRREFALPEEIRTVGMVAQLIQRKGHRHLFAAVREICKVRPETRFLIFGKGSLEDELKARCVQRGIEGQVQFTGFRRDLERILPCFDAIVHPADMEGLGVSLLQAAACGVPVAATAAGGIPDIVRDGENGYLVPIADPAAIAERLIRLLSDEGLASRMGRAGREIAKREFSIEAMISGNIRVYRSLLS
jgi:glycosyltransferase involved in cell wall biosynthesis